MWLREFLVSRSCEYSPDYAREVFCPRCYKRQCIGGFACLSLACEAVKKCSESLCVPRVFNQRSAVKICYRGSVCPGALAQNVTAVEPHGQPLTHRMPVTFNGDRLFRGRTA